MRIFEYKFYIQKIIRVLSNKKQKKKNSLKIIHHQQVFVYLHWKSFLENFHEKMNFHIYKNKIEKIDSFLIKRNIFFLLLLLVLLVFSFLFLS